MIKEEWISKRVVEMQELSSLQGLTEIQIDWITYMFGSAWDHGCNEGRHIVSKLIKDSNV